VIEARVETLDRRDGRWTLLDADGGAIVDADVVCLAAGADPRLPEGWGLQFAPVRGQVSWAEGLTLDRARAWGGYAAPMDGGVLFGATHDRGRRDAALSDADHLRNLATLAQALPELAAQAADRPLHGRAAVRATTFDSMPVAGPVGPPGLYILGGLGSRGFTTAPLLAEHVAAQVLCAPSPLPVSLRPLVATFRSRKTRSAPTAC
jgi:tRNA 5-methylaminomethyl-2-thiouridine biosynthesis bifunctional protein